MAAGMPLRKDAAMIADEECHAVMLEKEANVSGALRPSPWHW